MITNNKINISLHINIDKNTYPVELIVLNKNFIDFFFKFKIDNVTLEEKKEIVKQIYYKTLNTLKELKVNYKYFQNIYDNDILGDHIYLSASIIDNKNTLSDENLYAEEMQASIIENGEILNILVITLKEYLNIESRKGDLNNFIKIKVGEFITQDFILDLINYIKVSEK